MDDLLLQIADDLSNNRFSSAAGRLSGLLRLDQLPSDLQMVRLEHALLGAAVRAASDVAELLDTVLHDPSASPIRLVDSLLLQRLDATYRKADLRPAERMREVRQIVAKFEEQLGPRPPTLLYRGALALRAGQRAEAKALYHTAAGQVPAQRLARVYLGAYSVQVTDDKDWIEGDSPVPRGAVKAVSWVRHPINIRGDKRNMTVLLGSDARYFVNFAPLLLKSLRAVDASTPVHFHIVNWDETCQAKLHELPRDVSISTETYYFKRDMTYFATVRFLRAAELMSHLGAIYITDIDNRFDAAPHAIAEKLLEADAGFRMHIGGTWFPWWAPSGGNLWLNDTPAGRQVARWLANYVGSRFKPNSDRSWWFDQLALNEVFTQAQAADFRILNLSDAELGVSVARPHAEVATLKNKYG